jgi:thiol-disulfide isomerase/thioredoxin
MQADDLIGDLVDADVLVAGEGETFSLSERFADEREAARRRYESAEETERAGLLADPLGMEAVPAALERVLDAPAVLADYETVAAFLPGLEHAGRVGVLNVLGTLRRGSPPDEGAPAAFLPVHGDRLPALVRLQRAAVVYVWREDCDPCDLVREDFDELFDDRPPEDLMLYAVYGPDWVEELYEAFDVAGAPTTLFVKDGKVDARFLGAHTRSALENEVGILREHSEGRAAK